MIELGKQFTRYEWPLFWADIWDQSDRQGLKEWLGYGIENLLFIKTGDRDVITVWYDEKEWGGEGEGKFDGAVVQSFVKDPVWVERLLVEFEDSWKDLVPYVVAGKEIGSYRELKKYCEAWIRWWTPMALVFSVPDVPGVPKAAREKLLAARAITQEYSENGGNEIRQFLRERRESLDEAWPFMLVEEVLLAGRQAVSDKWVADIVKRKEGIGLLNGVLCAESELDKKLEQAGIRLEVSEQEEGIRQIHGQAASPGIVRGKVKVILSYGDIDRLQQGQILVTEMTMPSFVPAMKRAVAIVTDEGGITCHAAIVSRELGKPCVIGTRIATQVLKDGDLVEVDAKRGVVNVISRVSYAKPP